MSTNTNTNVVVDLPTGLTLEPDYIQVPGQNFALVSFVGPEFCRQKSGQFAMKIRGVFATEEEAKSHVRRLQRSGDNAVDIFLVAMSQWAPCPPDPMSVQSQEYQEKFLQDLMTGYADSQRSAKEIFNDRKEKVMKEGLDKHLTDEERLPPPEEPLPRPDAMPKFTKETVLPAVREDDVPEADVVVSAVIDEVFGENNVNNVWSSRVKPSET